MRSKGTDTEEQPYQECCMCGDCGFCDQLFQCKICQFRYQHRYCSNLYPRAKSYETCNMCLSQKVHIKEKSPSSSNSSSSYRNDGSANNDESRNKESMSSGGAQNIGCKKGPRGSALRLRLDKPIKKQRLTEAISPFTSVSTHKNFVTNEALEERVRKAKSEDITNRNGVTKHVFRNKVRRYKLLDELSS